jgi:hypothetical protein
LTEEFTAWRRVSGRCSFRAANEAAEYGSIRPTLSYCLHAEVKLLSTAAFGCSRSGRASTRFGAFLRRGLAVDWRIGDGLQSVAASFAQIRRHTGAP